MGTVENVLYKFHLQWTFMTALGLLVIETKESQLPKSIAGHPILS